ncbi:MAG: esterase/lipase family protein [Akkermansiaceae bacterium]
MPWHKPIVREADGDAVILLHGLWRSIWAMDPMAKYLHEQGYHTINVPYPSFRKPMEELTKIVHDALKLHGGERKVHFVTHSLGGIITRNLLKELMPEQTGRVVMLAPPNQGSEIIDWLEHCKPLQATLGPAGKALGTDCIDAPPAPLETDTAVIMGKRSSIPFFRTFLDSENDGIVSVERGKLEGMNEFHVIDSDHTFIATEPNVMEMTHKYLRDGRT